MSSDVDGRGGNRSIDQMSWSVQVRLDQRGQRADWRGAPSPFSSGLPNIYATLPRYVFQSEARALHHVVILVVVDEVLIERAASRSSCGGKSDRLSVFCVFYCDCVFCSGTSTPRSLYIRGVPTTE